MSTINDRCTCVTRSVCYGDRPTALSRLVCARKAARTYENKSAWNGASVWGKRSSNSSSRLPSLLSKIRKSRVVRGCLLWGSRVLADESPSIFVGWQSKVWRERVNITFILCTPLDVFCNPIFPNTDIQAREPDTMQFTVIIVVNAPLRRISRVVFFGLSIPQSRDYRISLIIELTLRSQSYQLLIAVLNYYYY